MIKNVIAITIVLSLVVGCGIFDSVRRNQSRRCAQIEWEKHANSIESAVSTGVVSGEFGYAVGWLADLTGIEISGDILAHIYVPNSETRSDYLKVVKWYEVNKNRLRCSSTGDVFVIEEL